MAEILYGRWAVLETLRANRRTPTQLMIAEGAEEKGALTDILSLASARNIPVKKLGRRMIDDLAQGANHQGVVVRVDAYKYATLEAVIDGAADAKEKPFILVLDLLQDPQNVGTLLRAADSVGIHGVIMQDRRGVAVTLAVVNASSGAVEHLRLVQVTNLVNAMKWLKEQGVWLAGLDIGASLLPMDRADLNIPLALVLGSEGEGMRRLVKETCDLVLTLPMRGHVQSLNVSTVGAVALYAAWQARGWAGWSGGK